MRVGPLMAGTTRLRGAVGVLDVDGDAEVDVLMAGHRRLAVGVGANARVHHRDLAEGPDDGEPDQVGEARPCRRGARARWLFRICAVELEQLGRHPAHAGRRGDGEAGLHVGDDAGADPLDRLRGVAVGRPGGRAAQRGRRSRRRPKRACGDAGARPATPRRPGGPRRGRPPTRRARYAGGSWRRTPASSATPTTGRPRSGSYISSTSHSFGPERVRRSNVICHGNSMPTDAVPVSAACAGSVAAMPAQFIFTMHNLRRFYPPDREVLRGINISMFPGRQDRRARRQRRGQVVAAADHGGRGRRLSRARPG